MANSFEHGGNGRFRLVINDFSGGLNAEDDPAAVDSNEFVTLKNFLINTRGKVRKRGSILEAGANSTDINASATDVALGFYDGPLRAGNTLRPYLGVCYVSGDYVEPYIQNAGSSRTSLSVASKTVKPVSKLPTVGGFLIVCGETGSSPAFPANYPTSANFLYGGTASSAAYTTGTVTVAAGSAVVTGSGTTFTSAMEGCLFKIDADAAAYENAYYLVEKFVSTTSLILDRKFNGDSPGSGKSYRLDPTQFHRSTGGAFGNSASLQPYKVAASAWGRLVAANTVEVGSAAALGNLGSDSPRYPNRVHWSGLIGSTEGPNAAATGIFAFSDTGFIDLRASFGEILAIAPTSDAVVFFQESGMTIVRGTPTYSTIGSLDASDIRPGVAINGGWAFESTPHGVFFYDKNTGPHWLGRGGDLKRIGTNRVFSRMHAFGIKHVGYYDGTVVFSGETTAGAWVYNIDNDQWSEIATPVKLTHLIAGRTETNEDLVALANGVQVVNLANMFDAPGTASTDYEATAISAEFTTKHFGEPDTRYQPDTLLLTYKCTDPSTTNPYVVTTVSTGLPGATNDTAAGATVFAETSTLETKRWDIVGVIEDTMVRAKASLTNAAAVLEITQVVVKGSWSGDGVST